MLEEVPFVAEFHQVATNLAASDCEEASKKTADITAVAVDKCSATPAENSIALSHLFCFSEFDGLRKRTQLDATDFVDTRDEIRI
jgi:hypothetical protein